MRIGLKGIIVASFLAVVAGCGAQPAIAPLAATPAVQAQALFAKSVNKIVTDILIQYDHNKNGTIELERPTGGGFWRRVGNLLFWRDERVRSVSSTYTLNDELTLTTRVYTQFPLFFAADANQDKQLTGEELHQFIAERYDTDHDGQLDAKGLAFWRAKNEIETFKADFGERLMSYREVDLPQPGNATTITTPPNP